MPTPFEVIAFDADDTLWDNERLYLRAEQGGTGRTHFSTRSAYTLFDIICYP